jgi:general secretion pathway protein A
MYRPLQLIASTREVVASEGCIIMYEAFYGLTEKPFNLTPDPRFLYLSEKHKEAFAHLLYGIKNHSGFVMVSGEVGTGKTTICRTLINQLDEDTEVAFIFNPCLSPEDLLRRINEEFGIKTTASTAKELIDELNAHLLERTKQGKNCVLIVDEAQNLAPDVLEQVRLLSNLETETRKLFQIVLIGQPELLDNLHLPELRQLNQRITARYHLLPLGADELVQYIAYRLRVAGGRRKIRFTRKAIKVLYKETGGTPRIINSICDRALLIGYTEELHEITHSIIRRAAKEIRGDYVKPIAATRRSIFSGAPAMLVAVALAVAATAYVTTPNAGGVVLDRLHGALNGLSDTEEAPQTEPTMPVAEVFQAPDIVEEEPIVAPPVKPTFAALLQDMEGHATRNEGLSQLLNRWGMTLQGDHPANDSLGSLERFAIAQGLAYATFSPTLAQMEIIDVPFLAKVEAKRKYLWMAVVGLTESHVSLVDDAGTVVQLDRTIFDARYKNQAVILWRDPKPSTFALKIKSRGEDVRFLQSQLLSLGRVKSEPSGVYNGETMEAIRQLQRDTGLAVDGVAGSQTRMVLTSWSSDHASPTLAPKPVEEPTLIAKTESDADVIVVSETPVAEPTPAVALDLAVEPEAETADVVYAGHAKPNVVRAMDALKDLLQDEEPVEELSPTETVVHAVTQPAPVAEAPVTSEPVAAPVEMPVAAPQAEAVQTDVTEETETTTEPEPPVDAADENEATEIAKATPAADGPQRSAHWVDTTKVDIGNSDSYDFFASPAQSSVTAPAMSGMPLLPLPSQSPESTPNEDAQE